MAAGLFGAVTAHLPWLLAGRTLHAGADGQPEFVALADPRRFRSLPAVYRETLLCYHHVGNNPHKRLTAPLNSNSFMS